MQAVSARIYNSSLRFTQLKICQYTNITKFSIKNYYELFIMQRYLLSMMSSGIPPPDVSNLSRRLEGAMAFLVKGGVSISNQSAISRKTYYIHLPTEAFSIICRTSFSKNPKSLCGWVSEIQAELVRTLVPRTLTDTSTISAVFLKSK